jgi:hypothetical protein
MRLLVPLCTTIFISPRHHHRPSTEATMGKRRSNALSSPDIIESSCAAKRKCLVTQNSAALTLLSLRQESPCSITASSLPVKVDSDSLCESISFARRDSVCSSVTDDDEDDEESHPVVSQALGEALQLSRERVPMTTDGALLNCALKQPRLRFVERSSPITKRSCTYVRPFPEGRPLQPPPRLPNPLGLSGRL